MPGQEQKPITLYDRLMNGGVFGQIFRHRNYKWQYVVVGLSQASDSDNTGLNVVDPERFQEYLSTATKQFPFPNFVRYLPLVEHDQDIWEGPLEQPRIKESQLAQLSSSSQPESIKPGEDDDFPLFQ